MKVGIVSLGCPKNQVDAEVMAGLLRQAGHVITAAEEEAEAIVVNTCSFIQDATEESIETILELAGMKDRGRLKYLIATGCLAQRYREGLVKEMPELDEYLGTGEFDRVAEALAALAVGGKPRRRHAVPEPEFVYSHDTPRVRFTPGHWAYLKISEGCDNRCTYCMIPSLRGALRSRPASSVVEEARALASQGVKELCVIAQDTTAYGSDRKTGGGLAGLLGRLERIKGVEWIRVLYTHPAHVDDALVERLAGGGKVVPYLDMPIQHIDDDILERMGRRVTSKEIRRLVDRLREKVPDIALRTSLMVGFPGETREKFARLLSFVKEVEFDHVGVFGYSDEEGTAASRLERKLGGDLISERRDRIMKAQARISLKKNKARVGRTYKVLVDGPSKESDLLLCGRAGFQAPDIDGVVYITDGEVKPGRFEDVEITRAHTYDLIGKASG